MDEVVRGRERAEQEAGGIDATIATVIALARAGKTYGEIVLNRPERVTALGRAYKNKNAEAVTCVVNAQLDRWMQFTIEQTRIVREQSEQQGHRLRRSPVIQTEKDLERLISLNASLKRYAQAEAYVARIHPRRVISAQATLARETAANNDFPRADNYALALTHTTQTRSELKAAMAGSAARHEDMGRALQYAKEAGTKHKCMAYKAIARGLARSRCYQLAEVYFQNSTANPDRSFYRDLALIAEQNKDVEASDKFFDLAWKRDGREIAMQAARNRDYTRAEKLAPNRECLAQIAAENGDYDRATIYYLTDSRYSADHERRELNIALLRAAAKRGNTAKFEELRALGIQSADRTPELAIGHLRNGNVTATEECMTTIIEHPDSVIADFYHLERWIDLMKIVGGL